MGNAEKARRFKSIVIHNPRTLIVHRKDYHPVCFYYTSILSLVAVGRYAPQIKVNYVSAILEELFQLICNGGTQAYIRVIKHNGKKSPKYYFDNSVYDKKVHWIGNNQRDLLEASKIIEGKLADAGIPYEVVKKELLE